jgi:integrase
MKIRKQINNGYWTYKLDYKLAGRRMRRYFRKREDAEAEVERIRQDRKRQGDLFARYREAEKIEMLLAYEKARGAGLNLVATIQEVIKAKQEDEGCSTVGTLVRRFLRERREMGNRPNSMKTLSCAVERFAENLWNEPISVVNRGYVINFLMHGRKLNGEPWHTGTKRGYLRDIKAFLNWCVVEREIEFSPAESIRPMRLTDAERLELETRKEILTLDETERLMAACVEHAPELTPRVAIMLFAGLRAGREADGVLMENIDFGTGLLHVRPSRAKDRHSRYVAMPETLVKWLNWSFERGHTLPISGWRKRWDKLRRKAELFSEDWPSNAARHSFASYMLDLEGEEVTVKALGHGTDDMLFQHYRTLVRPGEGAQYFGIEPS